jgi:putative ABC transport system permease protein
MEFFFRSAFRNHWRDRVFAFLNVLGLSIGLACSFFAIVYINNEISYDRFNKYPERIYRIIYKASNGHDFAQVPPPIQPLIRDHIPQAEASARMFSRDLGISIVSEGTRKEFEESLALFVDSSFLDIFSVRTLQGDEDQFLKDPFGVIISKVTADKFFGEGPALYQTIRIAGRVNMRVLGVVEDFPSQSHMHFSMLIPYQIMFELENEQANTRMARNLANNWVISHSATYVLLKEGEDPKEVDKIFSELVGNFAPESLRVGQSFRLEPLLNIHLFSKASLQPEPQNDFQTLFLLAAIALMTIIMATLNFVSLSTAQTFRRVREVALKKAMGARQGELIFQFLGESFILFLMALFVGLLLFALALPGLNEVVQKELRFDNLFSPFPLIGISLLFIFISVAGGMYPAYQLANTQIASNLKSDKGWSVLTRKVPFRQFLLWVQFSVSILLVSGSILLFRQLNFMLNKPLGFETRNIITIPVFSDNLNNIFGGVTQELRGRMNSFENEVLKSTEIEGITLSALLPGSGAISRMTDYEGKEDDKVEFIPGYAVDYDFLKTFKIPILEGRDFDESRGTDHLEAFLVNERACRYFSWGSPKEAIGKEISIEGREGKVIGVFGNYHYQSLRDEVGPLILYMGVPHFTIFSVRIKEAALGKEISGIQKIWDKFFPEKVFNFNYMEDLLEDRYQTDKNLAKIVRILSLLALIVAGLGSFGLIRFIAKQREKEIGIRKVLGASSVSIALLLSRGYATPFLIAVLIALPLNLALGTEFLSDYAIRVKWSPLDFGFGILITLLAVVLTVALQTYRSSTSNPAEIIRDD